MQTQFILHHFQLELIFLIFSDTFGYYVHVDWLIYLADLEHLDAYDWGGVSYAWLICGLDDIVRLGRRSYVGLYPMLMVSI